MRVPRAEVGEVCTIDTGWGRSAVPAAQTSASFAAQLSSALSASPSIHGTV